MIRILRNGLLIVLMCHILKEAPVIGLTILGCGLGIIVSTTMSIESKEVKGDI